VDFGAGGDRIEHELPGLLGAVGDLRLEAAAVESGRGSVEAGSVGRALELEVEWARVGKGDRHARGLLLAM